LSKRRRREAEEHENHERWLITYADMITLLMAFFIMMYSMSVVDLKKFGQLSEAARQVFGGDGGAGGGAEEVGVGPLGGGQGIVDGAGTLARNRASLVNEVKRALNASLPEPLRAEVAVTHSGGSVTISMKADTITFPVGGAELTDEVRQILNALAPTLRDSLAPLLIEGHTCDLPIDTPRYPSNWELSAQRATNVMVYLIRCGGISPDLISAVGYADTHPLAPNASEAARQRNRRVDIVMPGDEGPARTTAEGSEPGSVGRVRRGPVKLAPAIDLRARYYQHTGRRSVDAPAEH